MAHTELAGESSTSSIPSAKDKDWREIRAATNLYRTRFGWRIYFGVLDPRTGKIVRRPKRYALSLDKDAPIPLPIDPLTEGRIVAIRRSAACITDTTDTRPDPDQPRSRTHLRRIAVGLYCGECST